MLRRRPVFALVLTVALVHGVGVLVAVDRAGGDHRHTTVAAGPFLPAMAAADYVPAEVPGTGRPADFVPGGPRGDGTVFAPFAAGADGVKEFRLTAAPLQWEVGPGKVKDGFAYNGSIPGPTIRVNEGDPIRIIVQNNLDEETVVHWHGMILPHAQDGVPPFTQAPIPPGANFTYEFVAEAPGTHWYHSHIDGDQVGKGLHGSLEVVPRTGDHPVDRDYRLFVGDTNLGLVINGKSFPHTAPLRTKVGERVRIRLTATGEMSAPVPPPRPALPGGGPGRLPPGPAPVDGHPPHRPRLRRSTSSPRPWPRGRGCSTATSSATCTRRTAATRCPAWSRCSTSPRPTRGRPRPSRRPACRSRP